MLLSISILVINDIYHLLIFMVLLNAELTKSLIRSQSKYALRESSNNSLLPQNESQYFDSAVYKSSIIGEKIFKIDDDVDHSIALKMRECRKENLNTMQYQIDRIEKYIHNV